MEEDLRVAIPMEVDGDEMALMHNAVLQAIGMVRADQAGIEEGEDVELPGGLILGVLAYVAGRMLATAPGQIREQAITEFVATMREHMGPKLVTN